LLGEGTFHQVHGGVATNALTSPWQEFHAEYERIRGMPFAAPRVDSMYVGRLRSQAMPSIAWAAEQRTKAPA
jgi:hypothetical protein